MRRYDHRLPLKAGILLVNLGTPADFSAGAIRTWLGQFLRDRRVVEIPRLLWWPLLHGIILRLRPARLVPKYRGISIDGSLPLRHYCERLAQLLPEALAAQWPEEETPPQVALAMTYGEPGIAQALDEMADTGVQRLLLLPMYPQYSATTTAPIYDQCLEHCRRRRFLPELHLVHSYHDHPEYIAALAESVQAHWQKHGQGEHLLMSFHGLPVRNIRLGDPYYCQSHLSARLLAERLALPEHDHSLSFQSRFGRQRWLEPSTATRLVDLAQSGIKTLDVICPGFACDCLETLDEIAIEGAADFKRAGGESLRIIPCLNDSAPQLRLYTKLALTHHAWLRSEPPDKPALERRRRYEQSHSSIFGDQPGD